MEMSPSKEMKVPYLSEPPTQMEGVTLYTLVLDMDETLIHYSDVTFSNNNIG
jgi:hypothetical protein